MSDLINKIRDMKQEYYNRQVPKVVFNPIEKKEEPPKEQDKQDNEDNKSLLSKIKMKAKAESRNGETEKEKKLKEQKASVKEDYLTLYRNQMKAGNLVLADSINEIDKVFREMLKEDDSYNLDNSLLRAEKQEKAIMRNQKREFLQLTKGRLQNAVTNDMVSYFTSRYKFIEETDVENIEIVEKVNLTKDTLTLTTSEGSYEIESRKVSFYGGYLYLNRNILTEHLDLEKISKDMLAKNNKKASEAQTKAWLMVSPIAVPINDSKLLLLPLGYLKDGLTSFLTNIKEFETKKKKIFKENKEGIHDEYKEVEDRLKRNSREIVESLIALETPTDRAVIMFPYNRLEENGVKFECDFDFKEESYISFINEERRESVDYISWNSIEELKETANIEDKVIKLIDIFGNLKRPELIDSTVPITENIEDLETETTDENAELTSKILNGYLEDGDTKSNKSTKSKNSKTNETKNKNNMKKHARKLLKLDFGLVQDVILDIKASEFNKRDWSIPTETIKNLIADLNFNTDDNTYNKYLAMEINYNLSYDVKVAVDLLEDLNKKKIKTLETLNEFIKKYIEHRKKISNIQAVIGSTLKYPYLNNLELNLKSEYSILRLSPIIIENLLDKYPELESEVVNLKKYAIPVINPKLTKYEYEKVKSIVKKFGDRTYVNWIEILKVVALRDSSLLKSYIKLYDDVKSLSSIPEVKEDMLKAFNAKKFIPVTETETEEEKMFNAMFNEVAVKYKGLLCAIDYKGLIWYIVNTEEPLKGDEIIKYIPSLRVIEKYYHITESARVYSKIESERLVAELSNIPVTYLALNHILNTINGILKYEPDLFEKGYENIHEYQKQLRDLNTKIENLNKTGSTVLSIKYDETLKELSSMLKELKSKRDYTKKSDRMLDLPKQPKDAIKFILENSYYYHFGDKSVVPQIKPEEEIQKYQDKLDSILTKLNNIHEEIVVEKEKSFEYNKKIIEEQTIKIKKLREEIDSDIGNTINNVIGKLSQYYNPQTSFNDFVSAWKFYKFDKFSKGRILFNFIKTYVSDSSDIVKSATYNILRQYLLDNRETFEILKSKNKNEIDAYIGVFGVLSYIFKLDRILVIESADKVELQNTLDVEKPQQMSDEDRALLNVFLQNMNGKSDKDISHAFRGFERKDLIDDELYMNLAYNNLEDLEKAYPTWYNRDFNVAENLKIMLMCGVPMDSLLLEHRSDTKLMKIVKDTEIDPQYIAKIIDFLKD